MRCGLEKFWELVCEDISEIRFKQAYSFSPYSEIPNNWYEEKGEVKNLTINSFYRFDSIMQTLFTDKEIDRWKKDWLFDIYMHYLVILEYRKGITYQDIQVREYIDDLENGLYGEDVKKIYTKLDKDEKYYVADMLRKQDKTDSSVYKLADVLVRLLGLGIVYKNKNAPKELLLYVCYEKTDFDMDKINMCIQLFQPLGYTIRVFWDKHFAVMGQNQTLRMESIELL